jgi:hypothetical protein
MAEKQYQFQWQSTGVCRSLHKYAGSLQKSSSRLGLAK